MTVILRFLKPSTLSVSCNVVGDALNSIIDRSRFRKPHPVMITNNQFVDFPG